MSRTALAIAAIASAVSLFQVALLRVFSFTIWHHFAFMVISVALLGFALSGVLAWLRPPGDTALTRAKVAASVFGPAAVAAVWAIARVPFDPTTLADDPSQVLRLGFYYVVLVIPFTAAGLAVVSILSAEAARVSRVYAADLSGAAVGAVASVLILDAVRPEGALFLVMALALGGAAALSTRKLPALVAAVVALAAIPLAPNILAIPPGPGKAMAMADLDLDRNPDARHVDDQWGAMSRVDAITGAGIVAWAQTAMGAPDSPEQIRLLIDGDAATPVVALEGDPADLRFLDFLVSSTALQVLQPDAVLVIGAGGGLDVLSALHHGAETVDAIEINPLIIEQATVRWADHGGHLFERPGVTLHHAEGRAFARQAGQQFDLVQISLIDTWAAQASGAYSLAEGYLYTVEAFEDFIDRLTPGGALTMTRWLWQPPRETLKLVTVARAALESRGVADPRQHIVVVSQRIGNTWLGSLIVRREPWTPDQLARLEQITGGLEFEILAAPGLTADNAISAFMHSDEPERFFVEYPYDVRPATDDKPFFFQFGRWEDVSLLAGWRDNPLVLSGRLVLLAVLLQATPLTLLLLGVPVLMGRGRVEGRGLGATLAFFFAIGLGFMLLEICLMQRFSLFLGSPLYATATLLGALLGGAGLGSFLSARVTQEHSRLLVFVGIAVLAIISIFALGPIFDAALHLPLVGRMALTVLLLQPMAILMGMPFPLAVSRLEKAGAGSLLGPAWAANGAASVLGPILAAMGAIDVGFSGVLGLGAAVYLVAALSFQRLPG